VSNPRLRSRVSACGCTRPFGWLPALNARNLPEPTLFRSASARIDRAELPVQRKQHVEHRVGHERLSDRGKRLMARCGHQRLEIGAHFFGKAQAFYDRAAERSSGRTRTSSRESEPLIALGDSIIGSSASNCGSSSRTYWRVFARCSMRSPIAVRFRTM
jgi:hypothetical protein